MSAHSAATGGPNEYLRLLEEAWQAHLASRKPEALTVISLFAGCGGSSLGYSMAGFRDLLAVEWNESAVQTFKLNFPGVPVWQGDVRHLSVEKCLQLASVEPGELDVLDGSPPCQGFSTAGKRKMGDERNQLYGEFVRLLCGLRPRAFVMENVAGLVKGRMKLVFADITRALKEAGYETSCRLLNTAYFQVPQSRERLIWVGIRKDLVKRPTHPRAACCLISIRKALAGVVPDRFRYCTGKTLAHWKRARVGGSATRFFARKKLDPLVPSNTQGAARPHYHWSEPREMALNERAILQSLPLQFRFVGSYDAVGRQIGNSVPPLFMRAIALHLRSLLEGR